MPHKCFQTEGFFSPTSAESSLFQTNTPPNLISVVCFQRKNKEKRHICVSFFERSPPVNNHCFLSPLFILISFLCNLKSYIYYKFHVSCFFFSHSLSESVTLKCTLRLLVLSGFILPNGSLSDQHFPSSDPTSQKKKKKKASIITLKILGVSYFTVLTC